MSVTGELACWLVHILLALGGLQVVVLHRDVQREICSTHYTQHIFCEAVLKTLLQIIINVLDICQSFLKTNVLQKLNNALVICEGFPNTNVLPGIFNRPVKGNHWLYLQTMFTTMKIFICK